MSPNAGICVAITAVAIAIFLTLCRISSQRPARHHGCTLTPGSPALRPWEGPRFGSGRWRPNPADPLAPERASALCHHGARGHPPFNLHPAEWVQRHLSRRSRGKWGFQRYRNFAFAFSSHQSSQNSKKKKSLGFLNQVYFTHVKSN